MSLDEGLIASCLPRRVQRDQIKGRRVGRAVIRRVRDQLKMGQLAIAKLVQNLTWLGITIVVALCRLILSQNLQRTSSEFRIDNHRLQRNDQGIAAKQRHEPRQPGGRHEHHVIHALQWKSQGRHVLHALVITAIELLVAGLDFQDRSLPFINVARVV